MTESLKSTLGTTVMMFMILTGSTAFGQILAFTGASRGLVELATAVDVAPFVIVMFMMLVLMLMGTFMEPLSIMFLTLPIYLPIIEALAPGLNLTPEQATIWFGAIMLLNMQMASTSPPFGLQLFVMKGVAPAGTRMMEIYKAALPFLGCDSVVMLSMIVFPPIVLWLRAWCEPEDGERRAQSLFRNDEALREVGMTGETTPRIAVDVGGTHTEPCFPALRHRTSSLRL